MLGSYVISNIANLNGTTLEAGIGKTLKAADKNSSFLRKARREAQQIATEAGTSVDLSRGMLQELQGNDMFGKVMKYGGWTKQIEFAENSIRMLNAAVGESIRKICSQNSRQVKRR